MISRVQGIPVERVYGWLLEESITFLAKCWWCGQYVYFHRNGDNGGCALFDELGYPWPLHHCWEEHREQQHTALSGLLLRHAALLRAGEYVFPKGSSDRFPDGTATHIRGHLHTTSMSLDVIGTKKYGRFVHIELCEGSHRVYHVLIPPLWYADLRNAPLFELEAVAWRRGERTDFFGREAIVTKHDGERLTLTNAVDPTRVVAARWVFHNENAKTLMRTAKSTAQAQKT